MSTKYFLVGVLFCVIVNLGSTQINGDIVHKEDTTTAPETTTEIVNPSSNETTTPSSTTTSSTTTTAIPSVVPYTTAKPNTTTSSTTTTTSTTTTSTTTATPDTTTSTTTMAPTTTTAPPVPKPLPDPEMGSWILNNTAENVTCAIIHMALRIKVPYSNTENKTVWALLNLPKNANITGKCDSTTVEMNTTDVKLWWNNNTNFLEIAFLRDDAGKTFNISQLKLVQNTTGSAFVNSTVNKQMTFASNGSGLFSVEYVPVGNSYKCSHKVNINMTDSEDTNSTNAVLTFSKIQIQAFMNSTAGAGFGAVLECPGLDASDIVPIAVGCALAGLVIGVLIAYLVGRRRSHARGYLSM